MARLLLLWAGSSLTLAQYTEDVKPRYEFNYTVSDDVSGQQFGQEEARAGENTIGQYQVQLPDGRVQVVTYSVADTETGYLADVSYTGEAVLQARASPQNVRRGGHLKPDRVLGRLVARPSLVGSPSLVEVKTSDEVRPIVESRPTPVVRPNIDPRQSRIGNPTLVARPTVVVARPSVLARPDLVASPSQVSRPSLISRPIVVSRPPVAVNPSVVARSRPRSRPVTVTTTQSRGVVSKAEPRILSLSQPQRQNRAKTLERPVVKTQGRGAKQLGRKPTSKPRIAKTEGRTAKSEGRRTKTLGRPAKPVGRLAKTLDRAIKPVTRISKPGRRPKSEEKSVTILPDLVTSPKSTKTADNDDSTKVTQAPPTYVPAKKQPLFSRSYKDKFRSSETRNLISLFREDIKGKMEPPSKDGDGKESKRRKE